MIELPIAAREVAAALVNLALGSPAGRVPDLAGPQLEQVPDLVRRLARARGDRRPVIPVSPPGSAWKAMRNGGLVPTEGGPRGIQTFSEWLEGQSKS